MDYETPRFTLPDIAPHTLAKHQILTHHMGAWFPILGSTSFDRLLYVDGFAGPGEYAGGEYGSPLLALRTVRDHVFATRFVNSGKTFEFLFVEKNPNYFRHLNHKIASQVWPKTFDINIRHGEFEEIFGEYLNDVDVGIKSMPPSLIFIDPFGSAGFPMGILSRLASFSQIDILINFNWVDLNHWILPDKAKHITLDRLYGSGRWRPALLLNDTDKRNFLLREYRTALREVGWRGTDFEMINKQNQTQYYLIFGTQDIKGMEVIKRAMRSATPDGAYRYMDRSDPNQLRLMGTGMDEVFAEELAAHLFQKYRGMEVGKEAIQSEDVGWHPRWIERDLTAALRLLENSEPSQIIVVRKLDGTKRRRGSFPDGCSITFANSRQESLFD